MVRCRHNSLYTGIATDVSRRMQEHREGALGARYLRGRAPLELVGQWIIGDRSTALRLERRIKRLDKAAKEQLLARPRGIAAYLSQLSLENRHRPSERQ
jgi:putative endonuclease